MVPRAEFKPKNRAFLHNASEKPWDCCTRTCTALPTVSGSQKIQSDAIGPQPRHRMIGEAISLFMRQV